MIKRWNKTCQWSISWFVNNLTWSINNLFLKNNYCFYHTFITNCTWNMRWYRSPRRTITSPFACLTVFALPNIRFQSFVKQQRHHYFSENWNKTKNTVFLLLRSIRSPSNRHRIYHRHHNHHQQHYKNNQFKKISSKNRNRKTNLLGEGQLIADEFVLDDDDAESITFDRIAR